MQTLFCFTLGAAMARRVISGKPLTWSKLQGKNLIVFILLVAIFSLKGAFDLTFYRIPYFVLLVVWLMLHFKLTWVSRYIFIPLGDKSMMMWFAHGYLAFRMFTEYYLLLQHPILIYLTWVIVSYGVACLLTPIADKISRTLRLSK